MLDLAIVGAGLCGLSLARQWPARLSVALFDARARPGGRALTVPCPGTGAALDLGPTWFWPETEPCITALLAELGLPTLAQHDSGSVLHLTDPNRAADDIPLAGVHGGARRIEGGAGRLVQALTDALPQGCLHLAHALAAVRDRSDHVELQFETADAPFTVMARRVVLALPPRLLAEQVHFTPALPAGLLAVMADTPTWMAAQAKALTSFSNAFWRERGLSGNAFVEHPQAVLGQVFDAGPAEGAPGVLGGFICLTPVQRAAMRVGMPLLVGSQLTQLFGRDAADGQLALHDWAQQPWTCSTRDRLQPADTAPPHPDPVLRRPLWGRRLHLGGSETARCGAGHMEGALESAAQLLRGLLPVSALSTGAGDNSGALQRFSEWVESERAQSIGRYRRLLHRALALQQHEQLTQRAVLGAAEQLYADALAQLAALDWVPGGVASEHGRSALTPAVLAPFSGFSKSLLDAAVAFNRSSCAMSNFADEHDPSPELLATIARDLAAAWREFALGVNEWLLARTEPAFDTPEENRP